MAIRAGSPYARDEIDRHGASIALVEQQQRQTSNDVARLADTVASAAKEWQLNLAAVATQFRNELNSVSKSLSDQIEQLSTDLRKRDQINWQPYGILLSVLVVIGGLVYWPIDKEQANIRENFNTIVQSVAGNSKATSENFAKLTDILRNEYVSNKEYVTGRQWAERERDRVNMELRGLREDVVPRGEHMQQWKTNDERFANLTTQMTTGFTNLQSQVALLKTDYQRQIDEIKSAQGAVYGSRDVILAQGSKIEYLERQITDLIRTLSLKQFGDQLPKQQQ